MASLDVVIAIGSTGLGKSTLIKSYCKSESVQTSSSVLSCTKNSHLFTELEEKSGSAKRIWLDTMGAEDSEKKMKDEDILSGVMQMLVEHVPNDVQLKLKILWFVKPECRKTAPLQTQANFIKHIADGSHQNAWNSTIIVQKEGLFDPSSKIQGALAASLDFGAPWNGATDSHGNRLGDVKCIGYTRVDCLHRDDPTLEDYNDPEYPKDRKLKKGLLNEAEMMCEIDKRVNSIAFVPVTVHKQKCKKCGVIGDARWVNLLCHGQPNKIHPKGGELKHVKGSINVHRLNGYEPFHDGNVRRYHRGSLEEKNVGGRYHHHSLEWKNVGDMHHNGSLEWKSVGGRYHRGSLESKSVGGRYHNGTFERNYRCPSGHYAEAYRVTQGSYKCRQSGCGRKFKVGDRFYQCSHEPAPGGGLYIYNWCESHMTVREGWSCCNGWSGSSGCQQDKEHRWSCCNGGSGSNPCHQDKELRWSCCDGPSEANPCHQDKEQRWSCCDEPSGSSGCQQDKEQRWACCGGSSSAPGCDRKWSCCRKDGESGNNNGCKQRHICCKRAEGASGCLAVYECCKKELTATGCSYACCETVLGSAPCFEECSNCHREYGKGPGCLEEHVSHQMLDIDQKEK